MKIAIEATLAQGNATGFGQYVKCLLREFAAMNTGHTFLLMHSTPQWNGENYGDNFEPLSYHCFKQSLGIVFRLNRTLLKSGADLFHATCTTGMPPMLAIPGVTTVHDLYPMLHPEDCSAVQSCFFNRLIRWSLKNSKHFLCDSQFAADELSRYLKVPPDKITVAHLAPVITVEDEPLHTGKRCGILCVGAIEPRKNQLLLFDAYCKALKLAPELPPLTFIGPDRGDGKELDRRIATLNLSHHVTHYTYIPQIDVARHYRNAALFVFPSRYEGFGLPLLEAMQYRLPIICGDIPVLREIGGDYPAFVDPDNIDAWSNELVNFFSAPPTEKNTAAVENLSRFSWRHCAEKTLAVYQQLISLDAK